MKSNTINCTSVTLAFTASDFGAFLFLFNKDDSFSYAFFGESVFAEFLEISLQLET